MTRLSMFIGKKAEKLEGGSWSGRPTAALNRAGSGRRLSTISARRFEQTQLRIDMALALGDVQS